MRNARAWTFASLGALTLASVVAAQDLAPAIADPACAYHVEGRVLLTGDRPGADLAIERVSDASGRNPYSTVFNARHVLSRS